MIVPASVTEHPFGKKSQRLLVGSKYKPQRSEAIRKKGGIKNRSRLTSSITVYLIMTSCFASPLYEALFIDTPLHNLNLFLSQPVKFIDEQVDLPVGGFDLALRAGFLFCVAGGWSKKRLPHPDPRKV